MAQPSSPLEGRTVFPTEPPLGPGARDQAWRRFYRIVDRFDSKCDNGQGTDVASGAQYRHAQLIRLTYDYAQPSVAQDNFLRAFFCSLGLPLDGGQNAGGDDNSDNNSEDIIIEDIDSDLEERVRPVKATGRTTPQPSPAFHSAIERLQAGDEFASTSDRLSALRGACLVRDHHRCVVSRSFDWPEANRRFRRDSSSARDDDGTLLEDGSLPFRHLEVAYILPRSLTKLRQGLELLKCFSEHSLAE
ncbi:hypothetical protein C8A01DRAFT_44339 [Parachaetomium inaequale]|uniref:HNH nuclease domain-containing protein n=1 Tax=Parachaetomium inaequale TaxID=2588326 RepID=A0AAN6PP64_9PEZI|nr:hypothetical protein C8A01DRAFT_44339 [Parachaetomium inaequale]